MLVVVEDCETIRIEVDNAEDGDVVVCWVCALRKAAGGGSGGMVWIAFTLKDVNIEHRDACIGGTAARTYSDDYTLVAQLHPFRRGDKALETRLLPSVSLAGCELDGSNLFLQQ